MRKNNKIKYILPDFLEFSRNEIIINIYEKYPQIVRENTCIYSFYGVFPNAIWNGGGVSVDYKNTSVKEMRKVRDFYNKKGFKITFTFTNQLITEEHLHDEYCNQMLNVFHNGMNEVLVVSPILEKYIRENYPKYRINRSIINTEKIPFLLENYHLTVISKFKNRDFEYLKSLTDEEKSRTELLCNELCVNNCPHAYNHYREYANRQLNIGMTNPLPEGYGKCRFPKEPFVGLTKRMKNSDYFISYQDICDLYLPLGFQFYKLTGRRKFNFTATEFFIEYMIKPEYQMDVRTYIMERYMLDFREETRKKLKIPELAEGLNSVEWSYL